MTRSEALGPTAAPLLFAIFDLGGSDQFLALYGHVEADALLKRLAGRVSSELGLHCLLSASAR